MKPLVVIFLSVFFLFLRGYSHAYAGSPHDKTSGSFAPNLNKTPGEKLTIADQHHTAFEKARTSKEQVDFFSNEDDDDDLVFARKLVLLALTTVAYLFIFNSFDRYSNRLPFCWHLSYTSSYKYILQRVLRL